jgi:alpha-L-rhamnosidase
MQRIVTSFLTLAVFILAPLASLLAANIDDLRCEYQTNPIAIDATSPRLSWIISSPNRGVKQTAYQILVASSPQKLTTDQCDLWNSGKIRKDQSINIEYTGKTLVSRQKCYWKVRTWLNDGDVSTWSSPSIWIMGLLSPTDWQAKWIKNSFETANEAQYLRKEVNLDKPVKSAVVRFACLGFADGLINGNKPDETLMIAPRFANPEYRVIYTTLDVTRLLKQGDRCIGVVLGNGYNNPPSKGWNDWQTSLGMPQLMLELEVEFSDGSSTVVGTDNTWIANLGRIKYNDFWVKEVHDSGQYECDVVSASQRRGYGQRIRSAR